MDKILRILILEDVPADAELMERELRRANIFLISKCVETRKDFIRELNDFAPDLILSDYSLPSLNGLEALEIATKACPEVPFIIVSGTVGDERAVEIIKSGATDYVLKDRLSRLPQVVLRALREAETKRERRRAEEEVAKTVRKLRRSLEGTVRAIATIVEKRDPFTAGHQWQVATLATAIAKELGFSEEQIEGIHMAGTIHDIGKIYVPAEILSKPGLLTEVELLMIKTHPRVGYDILKTIEFPWPLAQVVLQHHEVMDGSGYPQGLEGDDILPEARILRVADEVEALASHRPYRPAFGIDKALEAVSKRRGVLFDPDVVDACLKVFNEKGFTFQYKFEREVKGAKKI